MATMSAINLLEHAEAPRPTPDEPRRGLSPDTRAILSALAIFLSILALVLPLTYLAKESISPAAEAPERAQEKPSAAPVAPEAAKPPPPVERAPIIPEDMRAAVITRVQKLIDQGNYQRAIDVADMYLADSELHHLWELRVLADQKLEANREQELLEELASIPGWQYKLNRDKYAQLVAINPDEPKYHKKLQYYQEKYVEREKKRSRAKR
jgi:hypothetical protein